MDILLLTYNRVKFLKMTIEGLLERTKTPFRLFVIDNCSTDGTMKYLEKCNVAAKIIKLTQPVSICKAYSIGLQHLPKEEDEFIMMQDDVLVPDLTPDWQTQLKDLFMKHNDHGSIACRIQKIPNIKWLDGDLTPARKSLSAYCRIQRKSDLEAVDYLGDRTWDDLEFVKRIRDKLGKKCSWANNLWCNHLGYMCPEKGYPKDKLRTWGRSEAGMTEYTRKPYPDIDPKTNVPIKK